MKKFIITVDTEGDNLWDWSEGKEITTENAKYIPRFQELCEKYGFKPVYLTNYEMANDFYFVNYIGSKAKQGLCEVGMHLHAWNTPPVYSLPNRFGGNPYITEYPQDIVDAKVETMQRLLTERFEQEIISHRAGRWATNSSYFDCLARHGIRVDCSVTPDLDLSGLSGCFLNSGSDYRKTPKSAYYIHPQILEVPMTTRKIHHFRDGSIKRRVKALLTGEAFWLRPIKKSLADLLYLTKFVEKEVDSEYLEFMIHSSELMPGGSIYFEDEESVEQLFSILDEFYKILFQRGYIGVTLKDFLSKNRESGNGI